MMAQFPHHFIDMKLESIKQEMGMLSCKNCSVKFQFDKNNPEDKYWFSPKFGYFCKSCLHSKDGDTETYIN